MDDACPLCRRADQPLTDEHVVPQWLLRDHELNSAAWLTETQTVLTLLSDAVVPVCQNCNRWMNEQCEQPAMPVLRTLIAGGETTLTRRQQWHLALWITKMVILMDLLIDPAMRTNPLPEAYARFRDHGRPEPGTHIWIGEVADRVRMPPWALTRGSPPDVNALLPGRSVSRTYQLGPLLIKFAYVRGVYRPAVLDHPWMTTYLRPIFPDRQPSRWPRPWAMDGAMARSVHEMMRISPLGRRTTQSRYGLTVPFESRAELKRFFEELSRHRPPPA